MPSLRPLPEPYRNTSFRVRDALRAGVNAERLRRCDLTVAVHGVRSPVGTADFLAAVELVMRPDQFFSHTTAARLWGMPLPRAIASEAVVHVSTLGDAGRMRRPSVVAHRVRSVSVVERDGHRVSAPADTWFACAGIVDLRALVAIGDHIVGRAGLSTIDGLRLAIPDGARRARAARAALDLVRVGAESPMESWLRLSVVEAGFPDPELNVEVRDADGAFLGRVDLAWPDLRIGLEYDGDHHRERETFWHDQRRDNGFAVNDWLIIHATAGDLHRPAVLFERLRQAFSARQVTVRLLA
jgi:hypothetical protein